MMSHIEMPGLRNGSMKVSEYIIKTVLDFSVKYSREMGHQNKDMEDDENSRFHRCLGAHHDFSP